MLSKTCWIACFYDRFLVIRGSATAEKQIQYDEDMGPEMKKPSLFAKRATKALAELKRSDGKQTRKASEIIKRVKDLCDYLDMSSKISQNSAKYSIISAYTTHRVFWPKIYFTPLFS